MISDDALGKICDLTYKLVELRWQSCGHLSVEDIGPEILGKLIAAYLSSTAPPYLVDPEDWRVICGSDG